MCSGSSVVAEVVFIVVSVGVVDAVLRAISPDVSLVVDVSVTETPNSAFAFSPGFSVVTVSSAAVAEAVPDSFPGFSDMVRCSAVIAEVVVWRFIVSVMSDIIGFGFVCFIESRVSVDFIFDGERVLVADATFTMINVFSRCRY